MKKSFIAAVNKIKRIKYEKFLKWAKAKKMPLIALTIPGLIAIILLVIIFSIFAIKPSPAPPNDVFEITKLNVISNTNPVKIEWQTNKPGVSKIFFSSGGIPRQVFSSLSGRCTYHWVDLDLENNTSYSYKIEAVRSGSVPAKKSGNFKTSFSFPN